jgi:uncharacterized protein
MDISKFINQSELGKNQWWRYVVSILIILTSWQIFGSIPYAVLTLAGKTTNVFYNYLGISFSFIVFIVATALVTRAIHQRPAFSLINPAFRMNWKRIWIGFCVWFLLTALSSVVDAVIHPGTYQLAFSWPGWVWFTLIAIPLTSIQTSAEELFFRGYLLQAFSRSIHSRLVLILLSGVVFAVPHFLNPEMGMGFGLLALYYFGFGCFLAWITIKSNSLEYALGIHAANNLFAVSIANYNGSALPSLSIFISTGIDPLFNLISFLAAAALFILLCRKGITRKKLMPETIIDIPIE